MNTFTKGNKTLLIYLLPTVVLCLYFLVVSFSAPLHDFSNSYFSARLLHDGIAPETVIFDIHAFNTYIWELGYTDELVDFYVNSPFTLAAFYPLAYIENPYVAKLIFNGISILLFLIGLYLLAKKTVKNSQWLLLIIPILFYVPIRNNIVFGQSYFMILFLVVAGYYFLERQKRYGTALLLGFAALLKFFPAFYGIPLAFQKRWKTILLCIGATLLLVLLGISITGYTLWASYFTDILPHTFLSKTTIDYRYNYQSLEVFSKLLFVEDAYYNPNVWIDNERVHHIFMWIVKALVIGSAVGISFRKKNNISTLLAIWVMALFLIQSRTVTYTLILLVIPLFVAFSSAIKTKYKLMLLGVTLLICNFPFHKLGGMPLVIQFSRLWLVILLSISLYVSIGGKLYIKHVLIVFLLMSPLYYNSLKSKTPEISQYALSEKKHFMIYDFYNEEGKLAYKALGRNGEETIATDFSVTSFDTEAVTIKDHQLYIDNRMITKTISLKKKPVLVNNSRVYFLTDHHSRRGAFTLKYIDISSLDH
ncbi:glycosyltransferase family 87 protein [Winogradskyella sp. A3E31]|uniref:glycosyltransferase family 87 protein n=1 Tax=Winogradskyella sp. A3E31 TaxID=3349637 RepID=UPI00398B1097